MEHYPFYYIPLTLPSPPTTGERIKVRGKCEAGFRSIIYANVNNYFLT